MKSFVTQILPAREISAFIESYDVEDGMDAVTCCNCEWQGQVNMYIERCPNCGEDTLRWTN